MTNPTRPDPFGTLDPPEELIKDAEEKTGWGHQRLIKYIYNHSKSRKGKQQK